MLTEAPDVNHIVSVCKEGLFDYIYPEAKNTRHGEYWLAMDMSPS